MDFLSHILYGFQIVFEPINLFYCFTGVFMGTLIGVLPGLGPVEALVLLMPLIYRVSAVTGIILLAGVYYGAMYGGSTTSILVGIPGEVASIVTVLDGHQMAKKGRAGPALGMSALGSYIGGTLCVFGLIFLSFVLSEAALRFGPPEYFALMCMGLSLVTYLTSGSVLKAIIMALIGIILSCVGGDQISGSLRFTLGIPEMADGINFVAMAMGLFGVSEVLRNLEKSIEVNVYSGKIKNLFPNLDDWRRSIFPILRGTGLGFCLGVLPGGGSIVSSFVSYTVEKKLSKHPEEFGHGAIEGVAGPETANNAGAMGGFVPLLSFGIPSNVVMALLLGGFIIHGVTPGPLLISSHPDVFWGIIASMYLGNTMLLVLNLPLIPLWVKLLKVPYKILFPLILLFCLIGSYTIENSIFDLLTLMVFGAIGYVLRKYDYFEAPLLIAFILGPMMEVAFRRSLIMSNGSFSIFYSRPICAVCLGIAAFLYISAGITLFHKAREKFATDWKN